MNTHTPPKAPTCHAWLERCPHAMLASSTAHAVAAAPIGHATTPHNAKDCRNRHHQALTPPHPLLPTPPLPPPLRHNSQTHARTSQCQRARRSCPQNRQRARHRCQQRARCRCQQSHCQRKPDQDARDAVNLLTKMPANPVYTAKPHRKHSQLVVLLYTPGSRDCEAPWVRRFTASLANPARCSPGTPINNGAQQLTSPGLCRAQSEPPVKYVKRMSFASVQPPRNT